MTSLSGKNELYVFLNHKKKERQIVEFKHVLIFWGNNMKLNEKFCEVICVLKFNWPLDHFYMKT